MKKANIIMKATEVETVHQRRSPTGKARKPDDFPQKHKEFLKNIKNFLET